MMVSLLLSACASHGSISAGGIRIDVENAKVLEFDENGVATATTHGGHDLRVAEERIWVDGVDLGPVATGNHIRMSSDGRIWVDGEERKSTD